MLCLAFHPTATPPSAVTASLISCGGGTSFCATELTNKTMEKPPNVFWEFYKNTLDFEHRICDINCMRVKQPFETNGKKTMQRDKLLSLRYRLNISLSDARDNLTEIEENGDPEHYRTKELMREFEDLIEFYEIELKDIQSQLDEQGLPESVDDIWARGV